MMSMLNHAAVEALCSATYLENYLDCMENLPDDLQRVVSQLRELDSNTNELVGDILHQKDVYVNHEDGTQKKKALIAIQRKLIKSQELGDEKLALVSSIIEHVENRTRQLEQDLENLDPGMSQPSKEPEEVSTSSKHTSAPAISSKTVKQQQHTPAVSSSPAAPAVTTPAPVPTPPTITTTTTEEKVSTENAKLKRHRRPRTGLENNTKDQDKKAQAEEEEKPKKKKKRKAKKDKTGDKSPLDPPIDPDEPTYCLCDQVSYGEMIGCDNDRCVIEWFHFNCVHLTHKPKGKWYCPKCRGDKPTVMRPELVEALKREKAKGN